MKIKLENVSKSFGEKRVLCGIDFLCENETVAIMGESGSGKTTLLRIIAGLETPDCGSVQASGSIAVAFAEPRLFENVTVLENVTCAISAGDKAEKNLKAQKILSALGLENEYGKKPRELSSGMATRVSLARAIASEREIYLLDEPLRGLDDETKLKTEKYLKDFLSGRCAVVITHDGAEAEFLAAKTLFLKDGKLCEK